MLYPAELRDRWRRYNRIGLGVANPEIFHVLFTAKNPRISVRNFKDLRARAVLGNRCSIRLSYGTMFTFNRLAKEPFYRRPNSHRIPTGHSGAASI